VCIAYAAAQAQEDRGEGFPNSCVLRVMCVCVRACASVETTSPRIVTSKEHSKHTWMRSIVLSIHSFINIPIHLTVPRAWSISSKKLSKCARACVRACVRVCVYFITPYSTVPPWRTAYFCCLLWFIFVVYYNGENESYREEMRRFFFL
jgi:hypothetical protein